MWDALQEAELQQALIATLREERERHDKQWGQQELQHLHQLMETEPPPRGGAVGDGDAEVAGSPRRSRTLPAKAVMFDRERKREFRDKTEDIVTQVL